MYNVGKFLQRVFGLKKNYQTGEYAIRSNNDFKEVSGQEDIILKERQMSWL